jgi:hypothetical protein
LLVVVFFIIQPSYLPIRYNHNSSISSNLKINNKKSLINIKNNKNESLIIIKKIILNFIFILFSIINEIKKLI